MESRELLLCLLVDTSGSTSRGSFNAAVNAALSQILNTVEQRDPDLRICLISYGTAAELRVPPSPAGRIPEMPVLTAGGFSNLGAALGLAARTLADEASAADGSAGPGSVVVVLADGLPTDPDEQVLAARAELDAAGSVSMHMVFVGDAPALALAGLRAQVHRLSDDGPELATAFLRVIDGLLGDATAVVA